MFRCLYISFRESINNIQILLICIVPLLDIYSKILQNVRYISWRFTAFLPQSINSHSAAQKPTFQILFREKITL